MKPAKVKLAGFLYLKARNFMEQLHLGKLVLSSSLLIYGCMRVSKDKKKAQ